MGKVLALVLVYLLETVTVTLDSIPYVILLEHRNDILGDENINAGHYQQIRRVMQWSYLL